jgi:N4-gp56 family major capsid protein
MAVTPRGTAWGGAPTNPSDLLVGYITDIIRNLEPKLKYATLGKRKDVPMGSERITFPQPNQIPVKINVSNVGGLGSPSTFGGGSVWGAGVSILGGATATAPGAPVSSNVGEGVGTIGEGTNPTAIAWGANSFSTGPAQFGVLVQVTDLLVRNSAIEVIQNASREVQLALARMVDTALQTVVNAGSNGVIYSGSKASRSTLGVGDTIAQSDLTRGVQWLRSANAAGLEPFEGGNYAAIAHPAVLGDLMSNTAAGSWIDAVRFADPSQIIDGDIKGFRGVKFLESAWQNYFNSTVPVMPTTLIGNESFGWGYYQEPTAILTSTPDSNNPLNLYSSIGGKVTLGVTRFNDSPGNMRIVRIESAFTA